MNPINQSNTSDVSISQSARIAGLAYLLVFVVAAVANSFALEKLIVLGDVTTTVNNIVAHETLYRLGIAGWLIAITFDTIVAWGLYIFLKPVNKSISLLAAWFRVIFVVVFGVSLINLFSVLELLNGSEYLSVFDNNQLHAQAMELLYRQNVGVHVSFLFFGLHIFFLGYLIFNSGYVPKILGLLLITASVGYLIDSFGNFISPSYASNKSLFIIFVAIPAVTSELSLTLWLLFKGVKVRESVT